MPFPMPAVRGSKGPDKARYLLWDAFRSALSAGALNNTPALPGPGLRTVVDTYTVTQMVLNGGFETAGAGAPTAVFANWASNATWGTSLIERVNDSVHGGSWACKFTRGDTPIQCTQTFAVIPGMTYTLSFWTRGDGTNAGMYGVWDGTHSRSLTIATSTGISSTSWTQFSVSITIPNGCTSITVYVQTSSAAGVVYFDDVSLLPTTGLISIGPTDPYFMTEVLTNPGFEKAGAGGADVFGTWAESIGSGAVAAETTLVHSGGSTVAAKITAGAVDNTTVSQNPTVFPETTYLISIWARGDGTHGGRIYIYDASHAYAILASRVTTTGTTWTQYNITITTPAGCSIISISIMAEFTAGAIAYFDDCSLKPVLDGTNKLWFAPMSVPSYSVPLLRYPGVTVTTGLALLGKVSNYTGGIPYFGFGNGDTPTKPAINVSKTGQIGACVGGTYLSDISVTSEGTHDVAMVMRSVGAFLLVKKSGVWTFAYPDNLSTGWNMPTFVNYNSSGCASNIRIAQLPPPWNTDYGIATQRLAGARSAGDTFTHEANCLIEFVVTTLSSVGNIGINFRKVDDANRWYVSIEPTGAVTLYERVTDTPTARGTAGVGTVANGNRVVIIADGTTIKVYVANVLKITYTSASNFATATIGSLISLGTGGAVSDIISWPRTISGAALSALNQV